MREVSISNEEALRVVLLDAAADMGEVSLPPLLLPERGGVRPFASRGRGARRLSRLLIPLAAAASVTAVTAGILSFGGVLGHRSAAGHPGVAHARKPVRRRNSAPANSRPPTFYVTLTGISYPWYDHPLNASVRATATGRVLATITPPAPYGTFSAVAGSLNDRTFVLAAEPWQPQSNTASIDNNSGAPVRFFLLTISPAGSATRLKPLPMTDMAQPEQEQAVALSPDGTMLAVAAGANAAGGQLANEQIRVYDLATSAQRTWTITGPSAARASVGMLSWEANDQILAFNWWGTTSGLFLLRAGGPGGDLMSDSTPVPALVAAHDDVTCGGDQLLTPDGATVVCPAVIGHVMRSPGRNAANKSNLSTRQVGSPGTFVQGYAEFSAETGRLLRVLGQFRYGHSASDDNGSPLLMWTSKSGDLLIAQDFYSNPIVAVIGQSSYVRIPWSTRISAGQGSDSQAAW
jgi:hypothetical protein